ncbi:uncharacterized protein LOC126886257 [Diabrotica virgifera virgifera]|uniref:Uncharacterized protein n=1 Tax=Diabrotica virgifera virgifera TaxID=50390 RepID=A0ABM5KFV6_DIAVI|nr:uncharacterized protein LOC126886257 [Diabrotica virgifera virgifera]
MHFKLLSLVLILNFQKSALSQNATDFWKGVTIYKECFHKKYPGVCLKEKALHALNETIMDDRPIVIGFLEIQKNTDYFVNHTDEDALPEEETARSAKLSDALMDKIDEFFKSRTIKLNLSNAFEGMGGGKMKGGGNMMMMAVAGMCAMMANMFMGKMAMMAGSALMISKISMLLSLIMLIKKMQGKGDSGGEEKHIVYADSGHSHGGGGYGGGGWHRSLEDPHNIIYKGQWTASSDNGSGL